MWLNFFTSKEEFLICDHISSQIYVNSGDTGGNLPPVSMTPAVNFVSVSRTPVDKTIA